jgi:hypothetical protein
VLPIILAVAGVGFTAALVAAIRKPRVIGRTISYTTTIAKSKPVYVQSVSIPSWLTTEVLTSAKKWAAARGVPLREILATIYVESRGKPRAWANKANEDSRGLMQVNIRAWADKLASYGVDVDDLWDVDKNIMVGSDIYKMYRNNVETWIAQSGVPQSTSIDVLTRLAYKGPSYVKKKILAGEDASHPYRDAEKAIDNWKVAMTMVDPVSSLV